MKILELLLLKGDEDASSLYVLVQLQFERPGADRLNNQFVLYHFELQSFRLKCEPDRIVFQGSLELEVQDIKGESFDVKMRLNLFKNAKVFLYVLINSVLFAILLVLCCVTFFIYRRKKIQRELAGSHFNKSVQRRSSGHVQEFPGFIGIVLDCSTDGHSFRICLIILVFV